MQLSSKAIYVLYTDDSILTGPDLKELDKIIKDMKKVGLDLTVKRDISDFLGINIQCHGDGAVHLTQRHLIDSIFKELGLTADSTKSKATPAAFSKLMGRHDDAPPQDEDSSTTGTSLASSITLIRAPNQTSPMPRTNHVCAFQWIQSSPMPMLSNG